MSFIVRETQNFILKLREIFPWRETVFRAHIVKSEEKLFFCQIYVILRKNGTCCDWQVFFFISEEFFLNLRLSLIVPLRERKMHSTLQHNYITFFSSDVEPYKFTISFSSTVYVGCSSNPCQNGGACVGLTDRYECVCLPAYGGVNCEIGMFEEETYHGVRGA